MNTPWGRSDDSQQFARGIVFYSTPRHGGFHLTPRRVAQMPENLRSLSGYPEGWYEEDCDWAAVALVFADEVAERFNQTPDELRAEARECLARWHPEVVLP